MSERQDGIVFASGTKDGGGSGFETLVRYAEEGAAGYRISAVASNHEQGGVYKRAKRLDIPFIHFPAPWTRSRYREIVESSGAQWIMLSGWLKFVEGLDPARTINIHPALLSFQNGRFGGKGLYGHYVHEAVRQALENGELDERTHDKEGHPHTAAYSGFTMHFVTDRYDDPTGIFAETRVPIKKGMTADQIGEKVNWAEHMWQPTLTDMVLTGKIRYENGKVIVPYGYEIFQRK